METPGNLFVVAAPSGAGKSSLVKALLELDSHLAVSVSHTTRAPRGQEQHGREYWFIGTDEFRQMAAQGDFFEWAEVHGNLYGTSRRAIEDRLARGDDGLRRQHAARPRVGRAGEAHPGGRQPGLQEARQADELEDETVGRRAVDFKRRADLLDDAGAHHQDAV